MLYNEALVQTKQFFSSKNKPLEEGKPFINTFVTLLWALIRIILFQDDFMI